MFSNLVQVGANMVLLGSLLIAQESPKQMFMRAREMQRANGGNDSVGAVALYKKVISALPNSSEAHLRLSEALLEIEDIRGAQTAAKKAVELAPVNVEAASVLAIIDFALARQSEKYSDVAKESLWRATKLSPSDAELWLRLADICETTQDARGALTAWLRIGNLRPPMQMGDQPVVVLAYERATYLAHTLKLYKERREACLALAREPNPPEHHLRWLEELAREQVEMGYFGHAEESFALLAKLLPEEPTAWQNIALVQRQSDRFADAIQSLQKAHEILPEPRNIVLQAFCLMNIGHFVEAAELLNNTYSHPDYAKLGDQLEYIKGLMSASLLMLDRPLDLLQMMESWDNLSDNPILLGNHVMALIRANNLETARVALKEGVRLFPEQLLFRRAAAMPKNILQEGQAHKNESRNTFRALDLEGSAYLFAEFRQWEKCLEAILEIYKFSPIQDVELLLLQSNALEFLGRKEESIEVLRQCQMLNPDHPTVQNNLGYSLLENDGDTQEAAMLIQAALEHDPNNAYFMDSWGWALFKQGNFAAAEAVLHKAVAVNPLSPEIHKHLGEVMLALGRPHDAVEQWELALAFAFPDRNKLERRLSKLKTELAKRALADNEDETDIAPDSWEEHDEWQP